MLQLGYQNQPKTVKKKHSNTTPTEKEPPDKLYNPTLLIIEDDYYLKDSAAFYEVVNYIRDNAEWRVDHPREITDGSVSYKVFHIVYETSDDEVSLNRKLDLLSLLFYYHYHAANEYNSKISGEIQRANQKVISRPILLVPVLNATYWSEPVLYTITGEDEIYLPKSYVPAMNQTLSDINELLHWRRDHKQHFTGPNYPLFDKNFRARYPQHHR